jgi:hypothetical protein
MLTFGIDFDDTWSADPALFAAFAEMAKERGHRCVLVTQRASIFAPEMRAVVGEGIQIVHCAGATKADGCRQAGVAVDIWIDDYPAAVQHEARAYMGVQEGVASGR